MGRQPSPTTNPADPERLFVHASSSAPGLRSMLTLFRKPSRSSSHDGSLSSASGDRPPVALGSEGGSLDRASQTSLSSGSVSRKGGARPRPTSWNPFSQPSLSTMIDDLIQTPGSSESAETSRSLTPIDGSGQGARLLSRGLQAADGEAAGGAPSPVPARPVRLLVPSTSDPAPSARRSSLTPSEAETRTYSDDADVMYQDRLANGFRYHTHAREVRILRAHDLPEPLDLFALLGDLSSPSTPVIVVSAASPPPVPAA